MHSSIFVVMAVFKPQPAHLFAQLASLAGQTDVHCHLVAVSADCCSDEMIKATAEEVGLPHTVVACDVPLDAVRAFEMGLAEALHLIKLQERDEADSYIALCDQDDIWSRDRLQKGIVALHSSGADLVHGDARLVASDGTTVLQDSMFRFERRQRQPGLRGLLYRNNITGMTVLMRPRLVRLALPFPAQSGVHFYHDLWLGLLAAATGGVSFIPEPLVDYRQHDSNAIGAVDRRRGWRARLRRPDMSWLRKEAAAYALARYLAQSCHARLADAVADGRLRHGDARVRALRPFLRQTRGAGTHLTDAVTLVMRRHLGLARIAMGFAVVSAGRTIWTFRQALDAGRKDAREQFDLRLYSLSPGMPPQKPVSAPRVEKSAVSHDTLVDLRKEPRWTPEFSAPHPAVDILLPTLNPTEIFAGIATALDIGLGLAARGHHVRFIATDLPVASLPASRGFVLGRLSSKWAVQDVAGRVSLHCGVQSETLALHKDDIFLCSAWWTAHVADRIIRRHMMRHKSFFYLIQDFEPQFYPWGPEHADAEASYALDFEPIFNTSLLRDWFADLGYGFAGADALSFHPAIDVDRYRKVPRSGAGADGARRLAVYGRPDVPRNMFPTVIETLARFIKAENLGSEHIEMVSIGQHHADVRLPGGIILKSLGKLAWEDYPNYLGTVDLGLSLMLSPHPSHPPLEMAAAGVSVVTNSFGPKDLSLLSPSILSVRPDPAALARALASAWHAGPVDPAHRRICLGNIGVDPETMIDTLSTRLYERMGH